MLTVDTFLRVGDGFVRVQDFDGAIKEPEYIQGALSIRANGVQVLGVELWDYIDQLWAYIADGVCCVAEGKSYSCYFPDQPIKLSFELVGAGMVKISVDFQGGRSAVVSMEEFLSTFVKAGVDFFHSIGRLLPDQNEALSDYSARLESVSVAKGSD